MSSIRTSLITIISCEHGQMRREQRDIDKRDLQKALKSGTRKNGWEKRWIVEFDGVVFITDPTMRREITSYTSPLAPAPLGNDQLEVHQKAKHIIELKSELCVSHTVLVVDNSGSMATHDMDLYRCRQTAAYTMTALEFVAEQLFNGTANNSDVVSLVEFSATAKVVFTREPISWVLYNKLLERRDNRTFKSRQAAIAMDSWSPNSNYLPALEKAETLLKIGDHDSCALSLLFISDGAPTDAGVLLLTSMAAEARISKRMETIASNFKGRIDIKMLGFGNQSEDFSVLKAMAQAAKGVLGDSRAEFLYCANYANQMRAAVTSLVTSLTETRTALLRGAAAVRTDRVIASERDTRAVSDWRFYRIKNHFVFDPASNELVNYPDLPPAALGEGDLDHAKKRQESKPPPFLAINSNHCGRGVERLAFRCQLSEAQSIRGFSYATMAAKESRSVERLEENIEFHTTFCKTQDLAAHLANEFNHRLQALPDYNKRATPRINFLQCSVLLLKDPKSPKGLRGVLVEKMLDTARLDWCKWNDNAGGIQGMIAHAPIDVDYEYEQLMAGAPLDDLAEIPEGDSEEEDSDDDADYLDDDDDDDFEDNEDLDVDTHYHQPEEGDVEPSAYLQAFTHFTYLFTNKKVMVCDLQGVYDDTTVPPTFELTDPAIHYRSKNKKAVFGPTDFGERGARLFFNTHKCTKVCKILNLSRKNKSWRQDWHRGSLGQQASDSKRKRCEPIQPGRVPL